LLAAALALAFAPACNDTSVTPFVPPPQIAGPPSAQTPLDVCDAGERAFVRRASVALLGQRLPSQAASDAFVDILGQIRADSGDTGAARRTLAAAMMQSPAFTARWSDFFKDALRVARTSTKSQAACYGTTASTGAWDGGALARSVRDRDANTTDPAHLGFSMQQLLPSVLALDDLSVLYRANLFAMLGKPLTGNAPELDLEIARRIDFGAAFEASYTSRDIVCLGCHNSEFSVTFSSDAATNRFWPVPGFFERALFGASTAMHADGTSKGGDVERARGMLRYAGVASPAGTAPFGWDAAKCGAFMVPTVDDPLAVDTYFGSVRSTELDPTHGRRASVWDLERSLHRGVDGLAEHGLSRSGTGELASPDEAFAYLVALTIGEKVWTEVIGSPLTAAHHFPRTQAQRDILMALGDGLARSHFSLKGLLLDILSHPAFNALAPSAGCGGQPYALPRWFDAWTDQEPAPEARGNSPADGVFALSPRLLRRLLYDALQWPMFPEYPAANSAEETLQIALGSYLRDGEPGRRELDFQGRLSWEAAYGACPAPAGGDDFITALLQAAQATPTASIADVVAALKDRLIGDARIRDAERVPLEHLLGSSLDAPSSTAVEAPLRRVCGALLASPWFLLGGVTPADVPSPPLLTPPSASYAASCERLRTDLAASGWHGTISCGR